MFQLHSGRVNVAVMFISYRLEVLYPLPSLRDTSAGGGYGMTFFAIATQSHPPGKEPGNDRGDRISRFRPPQAFAGVPCRNDEKILNYRLHGNDDCFYILLPM